MRADRLNAYSDAVLAILVTIMVLDLRQPSGTSWHDSSSAYATLLAYVPSFATLGVYWNNHHHMMSAVGRIDGRVLWSNHLLLFCLSLVPFATSWMSENRFARVPTIFYGLVRLASGASYVLLRLTLRYSDEPGSVLQRLGVRSREQPVSIALYVVGVVGSFVTQFAA